VSPQTPTIASDEAIRPSCAAREVWVLAWPAIAHMLLLTLVFMTDRALVGHYASSSLASMQISTTLTWSACSLFGAVAVAATALVARLVGAEQRAEAATAGRVAMLLALIVGAVVAVPLLVGNGALLSVVFPRVGAEVIAEASAYLAIVLPILPIALVEAVATACLHAAGDTRTPLRAATIANVVNLVLSATLIFGTGALPALGVRGAAIGSAVAITLQCVLLMRALWAGQRSFSIRVGLDGLNACTVQAHVRMLKRLTRVALPAIADKAAYHGGYLGYVAIVGMLGTAAMAANQALISVEAFSYQTAEGFGIAAATLVGQRLGARRLRSATSACLTAASMAVVALSGFALLFVAAPDILLSLFSTDPAVKAVGTRALQVAAIAQPIMAFAVVTAMALRGAGATRVVLWTTLFAGVVMRLSATWLFAIELQLGLVGVWLGSTVDWVTHAALLAWVVWGGRWRQASV